MGQITNTAELSSYFKETVRDLGRVLGQVIASNLGQSWVERIEDIRIAGRKSYRGEEEYTDKLKALFKTLPDDELLVVARAFSQFLNLANIVEQEHNSHESVQDPLNNLLARLEEKHVTKDNFKAALAQLQIELVLTAHPTEVIRRTFIQKYGELAKSLTDLKQEDLTPYRRDLIRARIASLISQAWYTDEIRSARPSPVDEAKWGFAVIENSLWYAVPNFIRELDTKVKHQYGVGIPLDASPIRFNSWMGGDRDGNPFVTAKVSQHVLLLARYKAANLFHEDISRLVVELSMGDCNQEVAAAAGGAKEPYRAVLLPLQQKLAKTKDGIADYLNRLTQSKLGWIESKEELIEPLMMCYKSLVESGMEIIAHDKLLDTIRRAYCFGIHLSKLDIRQDSDRHASALGELTRYLGMGDYCQWSEEDKQAFLLAELSSKRPLFPQNWKPSADTQEVLDTCKAIAQNRSDAFGIYIISMARAVSDVLCVHLLLQEAGVDWPMPVAPLFETLDDLNNSETVIKALFNNHWYRGYINGHQYVMIGYSDSAKDAGAIAAGWAQYQSQEKLVDLGQEHGIKLTLFHGRGGTIGRGGLPAHAAILSQPPGSLAGGFRVTEQGETIRYKFGTVDIARQSMDLYASAILEAILLPPPKPKETWREAMQEMAEMGRDNYRQVIRHDPEFVPYFRVATPEQELSKLPLGSRPPKRNPQGGVESLRAIPWIFAWGQTRLLLPSWLGVMRALECYLEKGNEARLEEMLAQWPFFKSRLSMLDMVFFKADSKINQAYDERLVPDELKHFGQGLREELKQSITLLLKLLNQEEVMESSPRSKTSMQLRAGYLQPLHYLQIELLDRLRKSDETHNTDNIEQALMVAIGGIAIGMRNTG